MRKIYLTIACLAVSIGWISCADSEKLESDLSRLEDRVEALEQAASQINSNAILAYKMITEGQIIMAVNCFDDNTVYRLDLSDGSTFDIYVTDDGQGITPSLGVDENGNWIYSIDGGGTFLPVPGTENVSAIPEFRANEDNVWEISTDGGTTWTEVTDADGNRMPANSDFTDSFFTSVSYDEQDSKVDIVLATGQEISIPVYQSLTMTVEGYEEGMAINFGQELAFGVSFSDDVADITVRTCPDGWRVRITEEGEFIINGPVSGESGDQTVEIWLLSDKQYVRKYRFTFLLSNMDPDAARAWNEFVTGDEANVLLDFSYAGYMHGEEAPAEIIVTENPDGSCTASNGYKVYNIESYGADGTDEESDRDAFVAMLTEALGAPTVNAAGDQMTFPHNNRPQNIIFYFPEGNFILHTDADNVNGKSQSIIIRGSNVILKGAGRDRTTVTMADENLPSSSAMYSSPDMIQLKHNTGIQYTSILAEVRSDAGKGTFSVETGGTGDIKAGDWVCLFMQNDSREVLETELYPYTAKGSWAISQISNPDRGEGGVVVKDIHQVRSVSGNTVTFHEPLMHEVDAGWGWKIVRYQHYENVGVEDITFKGNAKADFDHHASWMDDGGFKPISITRAVNSWMRRVDFVSVSEACSIIESANVSVYDCTISGQRGHSAIRSQASSRVFIGAVLDEARGRSMDVLGHEVDMGSDPEAKVGQYHAVGVSKESMGAVLWRNTWGSDGCFESHATQPRATLVDCCEGSFRRWRQGGDANQMPNHLADLTIWNFCNTTPFTELAKWIWWDEGSDWWKILPPTVVGFHGEPVDFDTDNDQIKRLESNGAPVRPESLYEAQLEERLGAVPAWLQELKGVAARQ